jgi:hypothetical protein
MQKSNGREATIRLFGVLNCLAGLVWTYFAMVAFLTAGGTVGEPVTNGPAHPPHHASYWIGWGAFYIGISCALFLAGYGLCALRRWGRYTAIVVALGHWPLPLFLGPLLGGGAMFLLLPTMLLSALVIGILILPRTGTAFSGESS